MNDPFITDDIFTKAAIRYAERLGIEKSKQMHFATYGNWYDGVESKRDELADLCERIGALKDVGAI